MNELGRILIAAAEESFLNSTADLLRREGYECDCASDAYGVLEMLKASRYDLLITDIHLPGKPELKLAKELPKIAKGMSVILVIDYHSLKSLIEFVILTGAAYIVKPFEFDELLAQVKVSIELSRVSRNE